MNSNDTIKESNSFSDKEKPKSYLESLHSVIYNYEELPILAQDLLDTFNLGLKLANLGDVERVLEKFNGLPFVLQDAECEYRSTGLYLDVESAEKRILKVSIYKQICIYNLEYLNSVLSFLNSTNCIYDVYFSIDDNKCIICEYGKEPSNDFCMELVRGPILNQLKDMHELLPAKKKYKFNETKTIEDLLSLGDNYIEDRVSGKVLRGLDKNNNLYSEIINHCYELSTQVLPKFYTNITVAVGSAYYYQNKRDIRLVPSRELLKDLEDKNIEYSLEQWGKLDFIVLPKSCMILPINNSNTAFAVIAYKE
jgi:hypothetical protein